MKYLSPFRVATYLLLLFFAGHTAGGMLAQKSLGPAADTVFGAMKAVHFDFNGADCTWYGFWFGFGITVSVFLLLSAAISWQLDKVDAERWPTVSGIAWALVASQVANAVLSFKYFFVGPGAFATLVVVLLSFGSLRKQAMLARH